MASPFSKFFTYNIIQYPPFFVKEFCVKQIHIYYMKTVNKEKNFQETEKIFQKGVDF